MLTCASLCPQVMLAANANLNWLEFVYSATRLRCLEGVVDKTLSEI